MFFFSHRFARCVSGVVLVLTALFFRVGPSLADDALPVVSSELHLSVDMPSERTLRFSWKSVDSRLLRDAVWYKLIYAYEYDPKMTYQGDHLLWYDDPANGATSTTFDLDRRTFDAGTAADSYVLGDASSFPGFVRLCAIMSDDRRVCSREIVDISKFRTRAFPRPQTLTDAELRALSPILNLDQSQSIVRSLDSLSAVESALTVVSSALADYDTRLTPTQKSALSALAFRLERKRGGISFLESVDLADEKTKFIAAFSRDDLSAEEQKAWRDRIDNIDSVLTDLKGEGYSPPDAGRLRGFLDEADRVIDQYARRIVPSSSSVAPDVSVSQSGSTGTINRNTKKNIRTASGASEPTENTSEASTWSQEGVKQRSASVTLSASIRDSLAPSAFVLFGYLLILMLVLAGTGFALRTRRARFPAAAKLASAPVVETPAAVQPATDVLRIFRIGNEYRIEYRELYERSVKVLEENRRSVIDGITAFVSSMNRLSCVRGSALDELASLQAAIPNLETSGNAIYRLFLSENIREELSKHSGNLVIRTDEQEIPWEIMHDGAKFLALTYPVTRGMLVSGEIRTNPVVPHDRLRALFIVNPTGDLPGTEREAESIIRNMGDMVDMTVVRGTDANVTNLASMLGQSWDIIHYAGHAVHDRDTPDESGLVLSAGQMLTVTEIKRSLGGNPLIFINACSSGAVSDISAEPRSVDRVFDVDPLGSVGIATAFMVGGAKGVVSTMWPVNDGSASDFATRFYSHLLADDPMGVALTSSKQYLRSRDPKDVTWSAFIYYGSPEERLSRPTKPLEASSVPVS